MRQRLRFVSEDLRMKVEKKSKGEWRLSSGAVMRRASAAVSASMLHPTTAHPAQLAATSWIALSRHFVISSRLVCSVARPYKGSKIVPSVMPRTVLKRTAPFDAVVARSRSTRSFRSAARLWEEAPKDRPKPERLLLLEIRRRTKDECALLRCAQRLESYGPHSRLCRCQVKAVGVSFVLVRAPEDTVQVVRHP